MKTDLNLDLVTRGLMKDMLDRVTNEIKRDLQKYLLAEYPQDLDLEEAETDLNCLHIKLH